MSSKNTTEVTAAEALASLNRGCLLIDVRTPAEFGEAHVVGSINIPLDELSRSELDHRYPSGAVYFSCKSGARGRQAAERIITSGRGQVFCVTGGVESFASIGAPIIRGRRAMSLDRQVRIGAGALVLLGVLLALTVHMGFLAISAFVGGGLVFAGVTDYCGMALVLARMPWNRRGAMTCVAASNHSVQSASNVGAVHGG